MTDYVPATFDLYEFVQYTAIEPMKGIAHELNPLIADRDVVNI